MVIGSSLALAAVAAAATMAAENFIVLCIKRQVKRTESNE
jgi:hypothetical protein